MNRIIGIPTLAAIVLSYIYASLWLHGYPIYYMAAMCVLLILTALFLQRLDLFMWILLFTRPCMDFFLKAVRFGSESADAGAGGIIALGLVVGGFVYLLLNSREMNILKHPLIVCFLIYAGITALSMLRADNLYFGGKILLRTLSIIAIIVLTMVAIKTPKTGQQLVNAILFSAIPTLLLGWLMQTDVKGRFPATFGHPNILAFYLLIVFGVLFQKIKNHRVSSRPFWLWNAYGLLLFVGMIQTQTRGGWFAFLILSGLFALFFDRRLILIGAVALIATFCLPSVQERLGNLFTTYGDTVVSDDQTSWSWRLQTWQHLWQYAIRSPLIGYGLNADYKLTQDGLAAHNDYLRFMIESGIIGLTAYLMPYLYTFFHALRSRKGTSEPDSTHAELRQSLRRFILCFIPAILVMSIAENIASYVIILWYLWALVAIYFRLEKKC